MRVTVCELNDDPAAFELDWQNLAAHVRQEKSDLVLLPEMPFAPWIALQREPDPRTWHAAVDAHARWLDRLGELAPAQVVCTRPINNAGKRLNEGFTWDALGG
jgi:N-carbamoylputrescine amidase